MDATHHTQDPTPDENIPEPFGLHLVEGIAVNTTDAPAGVVAALVIDPIRRRVTHLVVEPVHRHEQARLISVGIIDVAASSEQELRLTWTMSELERAPMVVETSFETVGGWPTPDEGWAIGTSRVLAWPYPSSGPIGLGAASEAGLVFGEPMTVSYDRIPAGTSEISRSCEVRSCEDHLVGHVDGFVIDAGTDVISHIVLRHGHLWGRREVTIPIAQVEAVATGVVHLRCTRDEINGFPSAALHRTRSTVGTQEPR